MTIRLELTPQELIKGIKFRKSIDDKINPNTNSNELRNFMSKLMREFGKEYSDKIEKRNLDEPKTTNWWWGDIGRGVNEAIRNALLYSNKETKVTRNYGEKGVIYEVEDAGCGFNVEKTIQNFSNGRPYSNREYGGGGMYVFNEISMTITWNKTGNKIYLEYLFNESHQ